MSIFNYIQDLITNIVFLCYQNAVMNKKQNTSEFLTKMDLQLLKINFQRK